MKGFIYDGQISASQLNTWIKSKKDYIKYYIEGEKRPDNIYTVFGSKVHKEISEKKSENEVLDLLISQIPKLKYSEYSLKKETEVDGIKVTLYGILDGYDKDNDLLIDYKTGKNAKKWNEKSIKKDLQFTFYNWLHFLETGRYLKKIIIVHLQTEVENDVYLTGEFHIHEYSPSEEESKKDIEKLKEKFLEFAKWAEDYKL